jgi:L-ascorbate metabolism protein UlaG (beta-lactamase superfamily)
MDMKITWFGHACFELVTGDATVIICDPYHPSTGYAPHPRPADIVTVSHEHFDHNDVSWIEGTPEIIRGAGARDVKGVRITGLPGYHDDAFGAKRGENTVFVIEADGLRLCHMGDLGTEPDDAILAGIGKPDVLFLPVGGYYTIDGGQAAAIAARVGARVTIPMHYATAAKQSPIATVDAFAQATGARRVSACSVEVRPGDGLAGTIVMDYLR